MGIAAQYSKILSAQDIDVSKIPFSSAGLESANAAHERYSYRATNMNDAGSPQTSGKYHFDSRSSTHLQSPRINASQPTRSKPHSTNHREEEDPNWPFAFPQAVFKSGVMCARTNLREKTPCGIQNYKRCLPQPVACTNRLNTLRKRTG